MPNTPAPHSNSAPPVPGRPLLVTADPDLLDDLLRLTAAADGQATVAHTPEQATRHWEAPLVVVGADLAGTLVRLTSERHPNLVLAGRAAPANSRSNASEPPGYGAPEELWQDAVRLGARDVLTLPNDDVELTEILAEAAEGSVRTAAVLGVVAGRGGAGASLLTVALGLAGVRFGLRTLLIDADPLGGGLDLVLGEEHASGARWADLTARQGRISRQALWNAVPTVHGMGLLTWAHDATAPIPPAAMRAVLNAATRGTDLVVIDLPRDCCGGAEEALQRASSVVLLVPAEVRATIAANRLASRLRKQTSRLRTVVRYQPSGGLSGDVISGSLGVPLAGELKPEPGLERMLDRGDVPATRVKSPLRALATQLVAELCPQGRAS